MSSSLKESQHENCSLFIQKKCLDFWGAVQVSTLLSPSQGENQRGGFRFGGVILIPSSQRLPLKNLVVLLIVSSYDFPLKNLFILGGEILQGILLRRSVQDDIQG
jgi:hypothetical protein